MKTLTILFLVAIGINSVIGADNKVFVISGDAFTIVKITNEDGKALFYELRRTLQNGGDTVLWRSAPQAQGWSGKLVPQPAPILLSPISAIHEQAGEVSLLAFESEADAFIFRFPASATQTEPVRIRNLWRAGDMTSGDYTGEVRFRNHGELIMVSSKSSAENLIRFDAQGNITEDFRAEKGASSVVNIVSKGSVSEQELGSESISPKENPSLTAKPPAPEKSTDLKPTPSAPVEESPASTWWPVVAVVIVAALGLLWVLLKKRK